MILHHLSISLLYEDGFSKVKNSYIKSAYYSICDDYGVTGWTGIGFIQEHMLFLVL